MPPNLISVIVPTFNRSSFIRKCIDSILQQTYKNFELIIVDDGSTDETPQILNDYQGQIHVIRQNNQGVSSARNTGIKVACGDYISFCDSDDFWLPKKLEYQMDIFRKYPDTMLCYTDEIWIRKGVRVNPKKKHGKTSGWIWEKCLELCIVSPSSIIMQKKLFDNIGFFDESLPACEDYDLWIRASLKYSFHFITTPLIIKNGGHKDQLSQKYWGMDRFRIEALLKCLRTELLTEDQKHILQEKIKEKCKILIHGFVKRNKYSDAEKYTTILNQISSF